MFINIVNHRIQIEPTDRWCMDRLKERQSPQPDDTEEWSGILNNMEWIDRVDVLDIPKIDADYSLESADACLLNGADDFLEKTSSLIDWKAWNSYLGSDEEVYVNPEKSVTKDRYHTRSISCAPTNCSETQSEGNDFLSSSDSVPSLSSVEVKTEDEESSLASVDIMLKEVAIDSKSGEIEKAIYRASGPLTWLPSTGSSEHSSRTLHNYSLESGEDRPLKRRGVKMKTNHRRFLNREAAFRYRERKRMEQLERKRELDQLTHRNILLKQHVSDLRQEIASFRWRLDNVAS
ncbi:unnamed protein product [Heligmosomoides polygyrus]|uniref:BZIP domain-containing protein n=1 Tax=Heligmosomoides polygyrus TaxID=6339 RepID=A0A183FM03_HELPZ|nr:unnamed protein product [Heligmosomoides polygyrus]